MKPSSVTAAEFGRTAGTRFCLPVLLLCGVAGFAPAAEPVSPAPILDAHNAVRSEVGAPPLTWSEELAADAADWADHLAENRGCRMVHSESGQGENLYWASALRWSDGRREVQDIQAAEVVADWASEKADYDYATNTCNGPQCGHYTQIVWADTREVGCARRVCGDKSQLWVCRYLPPGNWVGQKPY